MCRLLSVSLCLGLAITGCAAERGVVRADPAVGYTAWVDALSSGEPDRIFDNLANDVKSRWSDREAFARWCRKRCPELLVAVMSAPGEPQETLDFGGGLALVREDGRWRVRDSWLIGDGTPMGALKRFRHAAAHALSAPANGLIDRALAAGDPAVLIEGATARITLDGGAAVHLRKGVWGWRVDGWISPR